MLNALYKSLDKNGQYVKTEVIETALQKHNEKYPGTIEISVCKNSGNIIGFSNYVVEDLPIKPETIDFMFANPINFKLFNDLDFFKNFHKLPKSTGKEKIIYWHICVVNDELKGSGRIWVKNIVDSMLERELAKNPEIAVVCGMAINGASQALRKYVYPTGGVWSKVEYSDFCMSNGEKPFADFTRKGFEFAALQGQYCGKYEDMNFDDGNFLYRTLKK